MEMTFVVPGGGVFEPWREKARLALRAGLGPEHVRWCEEGGDEDLFGGAATEEAPKGERRAVIPSACLELLRGVICHSDPWRFGLAYRIVWRVQSERGLLQTGTDPDIAKARRMVQAVRRDAHKMTAFVRFREQVSGPEAAGERRRFVAWFEPEHHVLHRVAPFFATRFADMDWLIVTPRGVIGWDGEMVRVTAGRFGKPDGEDALDGLWRVYYASIFNPARVKIKAMRTEMPRRYWKNLPEAAQIGEMIAGAEERVREMAARQAQPAPRFHQKMQARLAREGEARLLPFKGMESGEEGDGNR